MPPVWRFCFRTAPRRSSEHGYGDAFVATAVAAI
jgi:hypothetical protein